MSKANIIVLGAGGQLGREWTRFLDHENQDYRSFRSSELDIRDHDSVKKLFAEINPRIVINCAAYTRVDQAENEVQKAEAINRDAVKILAESSRESGSLLIHYSTDYVFPGRKEDRQRYPEGYREEDPVSPINVYGRTKLEGENEVRAATDNHLIIRLSWLCGVSGNNFIKTMLRLGTERKDLKVVNDQIGSPTFAGNVVFNSWNLIREGQIGLFHLTSLGQVSWYELAVEVFRQAKMNVSVIPVSSEEYPTLAVRPFYSKLCTDKIASVPGTRLTGWKEGLGDLMRELNFKA